MDATTQRYVIQHKAFRKEEWRDIDEYDSEAEARDRIEGANLDVIDVVGPLRLLIRTETVLMLMTRS